jgi:hypothetical protein
MSGSRVKALRRIFKAIYGKGPVKHVAPRTYRWWFGKYTHKLVDGVMKKIQKLHTVTIKHVYFNEFRRFRRNWFYARLTKLRNPHVGRARLRGQQVHQLLMSPQMREMRRVA